MQLGCIVPVYGPVILYNGFIKHVKGRYYFLQDEEEEEPEEEEVSSDVSDTDANTVPAGQWKIIATGGNNFKYLFPDILFESYHDSQKSK